MAVARVSGRAVWDPTMEAASRAPFAYHLKAPPHCHLKNMKGKKIINADIVRQLSACQQ